MHGEPKQATSATTALVYVTIGALIDVWTTVYYFYVRKVGAGETTYLWISGFFFTGLVLIFIGLALGRIARAVRPAEVASVPSPVIAGPASTVVADPNTQRPAATGTAMPLEHLAATGLPTRDKSDFVPLPPESIPLSRA